MAKKNGGYGYPNPFNEVSSTDPNTPDVTGQGLYFDGWDEINKMHLAATGPLFQTPNSESGSGVMGNPAPGEPRGDSPKRGD